MSMRTKVSTVQRLFSGLSVSAAAKPALRSSVSSSRSYLTTSSTLSHHHYMITGRQAYLSIVCAINPISVLQTRTFATNGGDESDNASSSDTEKSTVKQHQEWIDFQKSISVDGFETGQTTEALRKSTRGGKRLSRRKSKEALKLEERLAERQRLTDIGGGEYPPLRYSDAETERLLAQAYASIPERAGRRGTRNKKRQFKRWFLVRQIRKKYKKNMMRYQVRKMEERSRRIKNVKAVLKVAPEVRNKDREYQLEVFKRWTATMYPDKVAPKEKKESLS
uniref:Uncharacterized protein n=1 Tax=Amphora coffeiformis TaxID=265554 RepID=A0A7S3PB97_9STRA